MLWGDSEFLFENLNSVDDGNCEADPDLAWTLSLAG